jgi:hypothetical protein
MIGLMFLAGIGLWLAVAVMLFPVLFVLPIADEIVGRWQFIRLCEREAVVTLSPDWEKVNRARDNNDPIVDIGGHVIPIRVQLVEFVDIDTAKSFLTYKGFHTNGGFLFGRLGLGLGQTKSCWPQDKTQVLNKLNIDQLIKQGKAK